ncbi:acyl-CoA dehydrogenase family protein [Metallosphaera cuprina]|uniref:Acyl-CoA dehydrogenase domain-containing protein n=1 Tax=Metallosphaera cuprina (strain Ar-4) TaxID=1006006 RepID=F4G0U0_METCR|nr:acyl-CoA dehydrogenase family protein [Metallosphaera cuprina]AEB95899.1 acyl-CoA dehydrogenase domain-containing protein [Metallosphaera cuprina Ar-4]
MDRVLISSVQDFARKEIQVLAEKIDREDYYPRHLITKMGDLGILDPLYSGASVYDSMLCLEEIAKVSGSVALIQDVQGELVNSPLRTFGHDLDDLIDDLAKGKKIGSFALSEPCCGSDTRSMKTRAEKVSGVWRVSGEKMWITQGMYADVFLVAAKTSEKIGTFLVREQDCVEREKIEVSGNRGTGTAKIRLNECEADLIGGWQVTKYALSIGRIAISAIAIGLALGATEEAYGWAEERTAFGKKLLEHEGVQWMFSDSIADLESVKSLLDVTCKAFENNWEMAEPLIAALKLVSSKIANNVVDRMVQIMGGMGYAKSTRTERAYRDVRLTRIGEGTDEVQRLILSRHLREMINNTYNAIE